MRLRTPFVAAAAAVVTVAAATSAYLWQADRAVSARIAVQQQTIAQMERRIAVLEVQAGSQPDWSRIAAEVEPSVVTVETDAGLGSGWVAHSDAGGSDVVTNFHVIADAWTSGTATVDVRQGDRTFHGTIARVDSNDDLAVVHMNERMAALTSTTARPPLGTTVMVVGSPLGLGGSISVGVVSGFRSLDGSDYVQFSAPISPGNSGGPVVDSHGRVIAIASAKLIGTGVEALSLAIPIQTACLSLVTCTAA